MNTLTNLGRTIRLAAWLIAGAMCLAPAPSRGQGQPAPPPPPASAELQSGVVIKKESKLVLVDSVVTDKKGNYIRDLTQNDFKVFEDNKEQAVFDIFHRRRYRYPGRRATPLPDFVFR